MIVDSKESHDTIVSDVGTPGTPATGTPSAPVSPSTPVPWPPGPPAGQYLPQAEYLRYCACEQCNALYAWLLRV